MQERAGERELLLHAAGEFFREALPEWCEACELEQFLPLLPEVVHAVDLREELYVFIDGKIAVEREALGEVADLLLQEVGIPGEVVAEDRRGPRGGREYPAEHPDRRCFSGTIGTHEAEHLTLPDREG